VLKHVNNQPTDNHSGIKQPTTCNGGARSKEVGLGSTTGGGRLRTSALQHSLRELILVRSYMMFRQV
jgi:hypothetical protein